MLHQLAKSYHFHGYLTDKWSDYGRKALMKSFQKQTEVYQAKIIKDPKKILDFEIFACLH